MSELRPLLDLIEEQKIENDKLKKDLARVTEQGVVQFNEKVQLARQYELILAQERKLVAELQSLKAGNEILAENATLAANQCLHGLHGNPYCPKIKRLELAVSSALDLLEMGDNPAVKQVVLMILKKAIEKC
jgi:cell division protein FtsB